MKATDHQILLTILDLDSLRDSAWQARFGDQAYGGIEGHRRENIQKHLLTLHGAEYSDGGMRSRLKKMVDAGTLKKEYLEEDQPYYSINPTSS